MFSLAALAFAFATSLQSGDVPKQRSFRDFPAFSMQIHMMEGVLNAGMRSTCLLVTDGGALRIEKSYSELGSAPQPKVFTGEITPAAFEDLKSIISSESFQNLPAGRQPPHVITDTVYTITINQRGKQPQMVYFEAPLADKKTRETMKPLREWIKTTLKLKIAENKSETATGCSPF